MMCSLHPGITIVEAGLGVRMACGSLCSLYPMEPKDWGP